ncbi:MAG: hypothetical protein QME63_08535 [Actinomycetota bacterium]|nr:hypothetical protein [Actinomycetota bacterium]
MLDDKGVNYPIYGDQCARCQHLFLKRPESGIGSACKAFPERIPREILDGKHDHKLPFPGDRGIRFEPKP